MNFKFKSQQDMKDYILAGYMCIDSNGSRVVYRNDDLLFIKNGVYSKIQIEDILNNFFDFEIENRQPVEKANGDHYKNEINILEDKIYALETNNKKLVKENKILHEQINNKNSFVKKDRNNENYCILGKYADQAINESGDILTDTGHPGFDCYLINGVKISNTKYSDYSEDMLFDEFKIISRNILNDNIVFKMTKGEYKSVETYTRDYDDEGVIDVCHIFFDNALNSTDFDFLDLYINYGNLMEDLIYFFENKFKECDESNNIEIPFKKNEIELIDIQDKVYEVFNAIEPVMKEAIIKVLMD